MERATVNPWKSQRGFTLVELLVVIAIIGVMVGLLLPAVQSARESGRRSTCSNNLKQFGIALHAHHDSKGALPYGCGGPSWSDFGTTYPDTAGGFSGFVPMLPFCEQGPLYDQIMATGTKPDPSTQAAFRTQVASGLCPSEASTPRLSTEAGRSNYLLSTGDKLVQLLCEEGAVCAAAPATTPIGVGRGLFGLTRGVRFKDVTDGVSKTIAMAEYSFSNLYTDASNYRRNVNDAQATYSCVDGTERSPRNCRAAFLGDAGYNPAANGMEYIVPGSNMYAGRVILFNTMLRPNSAVCVNRNNLTTSAWQWGTIPPRSRHPGGVQVMFADGAVLWIADTIDNGTADSYGLQGSAGPTGASIAGVWGALGTRNGGEGSSLP